MHDPGSGSSATRTSSGDMLSQVEAWFMFPSCGSFGPRAAFAPPAPLRRYPASTLLCSPPTSPAASAAALVPLALGLPRGERFSVPAARAFADVRRVGDFWFGFSATPTEHRGLSGISQVTGSSVAVAPWSSTPPDASSPRPVPVTTTAAFQGDRPLGTRDHKVFGAAFPTAQWLVYLRIPRAVTCPRARLTTGLPGSALAGRDLHPLDDEPNLRKSPQDFLLPDQHCLVALSVLSQIGKGWTATMTRW